MAGILADMALSLAVTQEDRTEKWQQLDNGLIYIRKCNAKNRDEESRFVNRQVVRLGFNPRSRGRSWRRWSCWLEPRAVWRRLSRSGVIENRSAIRPLQAWFRWLASRLKRAGSRIRGASVHRAGEFRWDESLSIAPSYKYQQCCDCTVSSLQQDPVQRAVHKGCFRMSP